jgi:hypothetical protein
MASSNVRSAEQDHFDLLPFIGIMMCLLGTLLLVTMSMAAINLLQPGEGWVPQPEPGDKIPVLIEWDGEYAVWHSDHGLQKIREDFDEYDHLSNGMWMHYPPKGSAETVSGPKPNALDPLVDSLVSHHDTLYALFAVRPSGFKNFHRFAGRFTDRDGKRRVDIGSEPLEQGKPVRLEFPKEGRK